MVNVLMESPLHLGKQVVPSFGMSPALTPLQFLTGLATSEARAVAGMAERKKKVKYQQLTRSHHFIPVAVETSGAMGKEAIAKSWANEIGFVKFSCLLITTSIGGSSQRGNIAAIPGTFDSDLFYIFYFIIIINESLFNTVFISQVCILMQPLECLKISE